MSKLNKCTPLANNAQLNLIASISKILENRSTPLESAKIIFDAMTETEPDFFCCFLYSRF